MKHALTLITVLLLASPLAGDDPAKESKANRETVTSDDEDLILGFRGKSKYQIVVPDPMPNEAAAASVGRAAELLQAAFNANGIKLEVKKESEADPARPGFHLGATKFAAAHGVDAKSLGGWSYVQKAVGRDIIIAGNDAPDTLVGKRPTMRDDASIPYEGTLFGMAEFVYRYAGARFLSPDNSGTAFVPTSIIHIPRNLDSKGAPFFTEHDFSISRDLFYTANHCGRFQRIWSRYGHQHPSAVPISKYGKDHPEYFILSGGVRQPALTMKDGEGQLCFSNPDVRELIYKHILERCDEGFDIVELGQADGFRSCQCSECAELYGVTPESVTADGSAYNIWGEKIWIMHRDMALRLLKDRPGKRIMMSAYSVAAPPPRTFNEFPPNTIIEMMDSSEKSFEAWKAIKAPGGFSAYLYNWGALHLKGMTVAQIAEQNRRLVTNNVHAVQVNGVPRSSEWGLGGPNIYIYLRLGIDPFTKSADELFNEYLQAAFRESEAQMRRFFLSFQKRVALLDIIQEYTSKVDRDPFFTLGTLYTPDLINAMEEDLTQAEKNAQLPEVKTRLDVVRYEFDFLKHTVLVLNAYRNHQAMNDAASLNQLLDAVDARNQFVAAVVNGDGKYPKWKNPAFPQRKKDELKYLQTYMDRAPFNWDTATMRANPAPLSQQSKSLEITKVSGPLTLDSPLWKSAEEHPLGPVEGAATDLQAQTTFRVLCDDSHLYVRVSGEQPAAKMKFAARGRDAELWLQESIIVNVSPSGDRSRYFYFAYEPEPTSFNDAEHGFITDVLHPRYGWNDESWNGKWTFETQLMPDKNRWESMAVIPFETLRTAAPKKGDMWYLNVGRVHFTDAAQKTDDRELSVWTGKLNASRIPGDASFGKATFK